MTRSAGSSTASRRNFRNDHFLELANSTGRARFVRGTWGACVGGRRRPRAGELLKVTLRSGAWDHMFVAAVVDGAPGRWRVLTAWPKAAENCSNRAAPPAGTGDGGGNTSGRRQARGRSGCA